MTSEKLLNISKEISKAEHIRDEAKAKKAAQEYKKMQYQEAWSSFEDYGDMTD